jgi:hypothetical protein
MAMGLDNLNVSFQQRQQMLRESAEKPLEEAK